MIKKAVIPAAGSASRLRPLTNTRHKSMLPIGKTTMMELILNNLIGAGIEQLLIITGFMADDLEKHVLDHCGKIEPYFIKNEKYDSTNNAYSLYLAREFAADSSFLLLDSDIIFEYETLARVMGSPYQNALAIQKRKNLSDEEMKVYSSNGNNVSQITKAGNPPEALGESIGIEKFSAPFSTALFQVLQRRVEEGEGTTEYYEASFQELIDEGWDLNLVDITDTAVMEVDFKEDLDKAASDILPIILKSGS